MLRHFPSLIFVFLTSRQVARARSRSWRTRKIAFLTPATVDAHSFRSSTLPYDSRIRLAHLETPPFHPR